jgi:hypothetical protein
MLHDVPIFSVIFLLCGLLGGIARIFFDRRIKPRQAVGYLVVGAIAGNFFVKPIFIIASYFAFGLTKFGPQLLDVIQVFPPEVVALIVGMFGIDYCRFMQKKLKQFERTKNG